MIAIYRPCGVLKDAAGNILDQFKAVGYCLPTSDKVRYNMTGKWSKSQKHGIQFEVERYEEVITPTREGIIAYLASGQIRGIGKKTAERIYDTFGQETLQVLDQEPKKLLTVRGISEKKLRKIVDSYLANRGARDVIAFLAPTVSAPAELSGCTGNTARRPWTSSVTILIGYVSWPVSHSGLLINWQ